MMKEIKDMLARLFRIHQTGIHASAIATDKAEDRALKRLENEVMGRKAAYGANIQKAGEK